MYSYDFLWIVMDSLKLLFGKAARFVCLLALLLARRLLRELGPPRPRVILVLSDARRGTWVLTGASDVWMGGCSWPYRRFLRRNCYRNTLGGDTDPFLRSVCLWISNGTLTRSWLAFHR